MLCIICKLFQTDKAQHFKMLEQNVLKCKIQHLKHFFLQFILSKTKIKLYIQMKENRNFNIKMNAQTEHSSLRLKKIRIEKKYKKVFK